jgi:hypothetical protein
MKRVVTCIFGLVATIAFTTTSASTEQIVVEYSFSRPEISQITIGNDSYHRVTIPDAPNGGKIGEPALPAKGAYILLPAGTEATKIEILAAKTIPLGSSYTIEPVGQPIPLSSDGGAASLPAPDPSIYDSDDLFPAKRGEEIGTQRFRGYRILILKLRPVGLFPVSGELLFYPKLTVIVTTAESARPSPLFRGLSDDEVEISCKVDNPESIHSYQQLGGLRDDAYDLLIITDSQLEAAFQLLKGYHDTTGILTEIHTTSDIGSSDPDDVRDYITERYLNDGIRYLLIGGDDDLLPAKDLYVQYYTGGTTEYEMPADIYFACLDGTFNYDGDALWGEPTDGEDGSDVDLIAEVYVGRASVDNITEASRFVSKTIQYLTTYDPCLENVLMAGEYLGFGGTGDYGGYSLDEIIDGSNAHGCVTSGIPSSKYEIDKLYDRDWLNNYWPPSEMVSRINNGLHIVNHYGHSNTNRALRLTSNDVVNLLTNDNLCFVYSQGCLAGHFDGMDCWAENMTVKTDHGAFAAVMNARYGLGAIWSTDGASHRFNREFWDAVFNPLEGMPELGRANQDSKEDNLYRINEGCMRWCYYELTLFGDPTVAIRELRSIAFEYPYGIPEIVTPSQTTSVVVDVSAIGNGVPVSGSGQIHYSINSGDVQTVSMAEIQPNEYEALLPPILCGNRLEFYVSAEESTTGRVYDTDPGMPHPVKPGSIEVTVFEDNFETDNGWSVSGGQWERGIPTGDGGNMYSGPDPTTGHDGPNVFGYNLTGNYTDVLPEMHLTSPPVDCTDMSGTRLKFWRWLGVEAPSFDHAYVRISTDGASWTTIWRNSAEVFDASWTEINLDISDIADNRPQVYLRWTMGTTDASLTYCGWNIDGVRVLGYECPRSVCGDPDGSGAVDIDDVVFLIGYIFSSGPAPDPIVAGDPDCSGGIDIDDVVYLISFVFSGGNPPCDTNGDLIPDC